MSTDKVKSRKASNVIIPPLKTSSKLDNNKELSRSDSATKILIITPNTPPGYNPNTLLKDKIKTEINSKRQPEDYSMILSNQSMECINKLAKI